MNITQKPSPNYDTNRKNIDRIVIHWIVGNLASADAVFAKAGGTSAHYAIEDSKIHQYVQEGHVAYHAGNYAMNQRSIGIEHSAAPDRPASLATYKTSGLLVKEICERYNIPIDKAHIIPHRDVVSTQCPGTINIDTIIHYATQDINSPPPVSELEACLIAHREAVESANRKDEELKKCKEELTELRVEFEKYKDDAMRTMSELQLQIENMKLNHEEILKAELAKAKINYEMELAKQYNELSLTHSRREEELLKKIQELEEREPTKIVHVETPLNERFKGKSFKEKLVSVIEILYA